VTFGVPNVILSEARICFSQFVRSRFFVAFGSSE